MAKPIPDGEERCSGSGHPITRDFISKNKNKVLKLAQLGCTQLEIAYVLNICEDSVRAHFLDEFHRGQGDLKSSIRKAQLEVALQEKNTTMLVWLGKQFLKQCEPKTNVEHSGTVIKVVKVLFGSEGTGDKSS